MKKQTSNITDSISELLRLRHDIVVGADDDFRVSSMEEISGGYDADYGYLTLLLGAIAGFRYW